jgi:hypothetical protein
MRTPQGLLLDLGNTLLGEVVFDAAAGQARLLSLASRVPPGVTLEDVQAQAQRVDASMRSRRESSLLEFRAISVTRLVYERFGMEFDHPAGHPAEGPSPDAEIRDWEDLAGFLP